MARLPSLSCMKESPLQALRLQRTSLWTQLGVEVSGIAESLADYLLSLFAPCSRLENVDQDIKGQSHVHHASKFHLQVWPTLASASVVLEEWVLHGKSPAPYASKFAIIRKLRGLKDAVNWGYVEIPPTPVVEVLLSTELEEHVTNRQLTPLATITTEFSLSTIDGEFPKHSHGKEHVDNIVVLLEQPQDDGLSRAADESPLDSLFKRIQQELQCYDLRQESRGGGLTLPAFVNAKSKPRFNLADLRKKDKEFEDAKTIKKYKKLVKGSPREEVRPIFEEFSGVLGAEGKATPVSKSNSNRFQGSHTALFVRKEGHGPNKGKNALEALRKDYVKKKEEEDRLKAERLEALKAKEEVRSKALQTRKNLKAKMFKRTNSGQPLMKHRLEHILDSIQQHQ
ncbi:hypothetical protein GOP47_0013931 [Adiantum capillus-veneris]|uniref:Uncharacterized protein n=1 Tax=Adiantum capillus-veneris TaxID=13818 RepID=A0A9D4ZFV4_ADICA|nr:hypothetical protein GOP47_0013931 [Adiantum capillus-veneris]